MVTVQKVEHVSGVHAGGEGGGEMTLAGGGGTNVRVPQSLQSEPTVQAV
jgi:hypothetical protein